MELSTILWICGVATAYYTGNFVGKKHGKAEISALRSQLNATKQSEGEKVSPETVEGSSAKQSVKSENVKKQQPAKEAFWGNIERFSPKLNTLLDGSYNSSDWTDDIVDINNDELTNIWKKASKKVDYVLRIFGMWGLKPEYCTSFVANGIEMEMYETINGEAIIKGQKYFVKTPCWILTDDAQSKKTIVLKGTVTDEDN